MPNSLIIQDCVYDMTPAYLNGARAMRSRTPSRCNPHRHGSQAYYDWDHGHLNEAGNEHLRFGLDLLAQKARAKTFEMDPEVPRDQHDEVDEDWAREALRKLRMKA